MPKRKVTTSGSGAQGYIKRTKRMSHPSQGLIWKSKDWKKDREITKYVSVMVHVLNRTQKVIKKEMRMDRHRGFPREIWISRMIPDCNRITRPLEYFRDQNPDFGTAIYEHCPLGDLAQWKKAMFDARNKPVPESFIWRFFLQISQALAVLQANIGPDANERNIILHRDIKPANILVVDNGTTYPSFKLHDFDVACIYEESKATQRAIMGTFKYQPPENPIINTEAAEIWALGVCVHYLATGELPIENPERYRDKVIAEKAQRMKELNNNLANIGKTVDMDSNATVGHIATLKYNANVENNTIKSPAMWNYTHPMQYYRARAPRRVLPINLSQTEQEQQGIGPRVGKDKEYFIHQYSEELNNWMQQCLSMSPNERPTSERLINEMGITAKAMLKIMGGAAGLKDMDVQFGPNS